MLSLSEQNGELVVRMPSFLQLVKAGFAFALGASLVAFVGVIVWWIFLLGFVGAMLSGPARPSLVPPPQHSSHR